MVLGRRNSHSPKTMRTSASVPLVIGCELRKVGYAGVYYQSGQPAGTTLTEVA